MFGVNYISFSFGPASPSNVEIVPFEGPFNAIMRNISTGTADILPDKLFMTSVYLKSKKRVRISNR